MNINYLLSKLQYFIPKKALSRIAGSLAKSNNPWISQTFIKYFMRAYPINLSEAKLKKPSDYTSFQSFFTRELEENARSFPNDCDTLCSPVDGTISQKGTINNNFLFTAKNKPYSLEELLGNDEYAQQFQGGTFITIYLAPHDYHRVHMPCYGNLQQARYIKGSLFSVNKSSESYIPNIFAKNERLVYEFDIENNNKMALIMVGALIVSGIQPIWEKNTGKKEVEKNDKIANQRFNQGDEVGLFNLGSTVILCFPKNSFELSKNLRTDDAVKLGEVIGSSHVRPSPN